ncbi:Membrane protein [Pseudomonas syringae pv. primulae]|uniref:Membrane protein n=1 Tax=Pseudomonas syringae pv. primulae TaxID=251707 RepID=A0A3M4RXD9_9PSED|nr:Membrane protein [Pseudomonas syringae pv. primulae]
MRLHRLAGPKATRNQVISAPCCTPPGPRTGRCCTLEPIF